jgi:hypothetical protein
VKRNYHVIDCKGKGAERTLAAFCRANGQILLPLVELVERAHPNAPSTLDARNSRIVDGWSANRRLSSAGNF